jgi:two-component system response regulator AtoC/two-component system response regulator FlrC
MTNDHHGPKHILVVNDDEAILGLFQELLGDEGYKVTLDKFGRKTTELLQTMRELQPDLVIMDFIIGHEDSGWQLLQVAKMDRDTRGIPVIVCTGAVRQITELSEHLDAMNVHVVLKPFDIDHLLEIVAKTWVSQESPTPGLDTVDRSVSEERDPKMDPHRG